MTHVLLALVSVSSIGMIASVFCAPNAVERFRAMAIIFHWYLVALVLFSLISQAYGLAIGGVAISLLHSFVGVISMWLFWRQLDSDRVREIVSVWDASSTFIALLGIGVFVVALYISLITPLSSWDALTHWVARADSVMEQQVASGYSGAIDLDPHRHPATVVFAAVAGAALVEIGVLPQWMAGALPLWFIVWALIVVTTALAVHVANSSLSISVLAAFLLLTSPLLETHSIMGGYADIFVAACVALSTAILSIGIRLGDRLWLFWGGSVAVMCMAFKNTGVIYAAAIASSVLFTLGARKTLVTLLVIVGTTVLACYFFAVSIELPLLGKFGFTQTDRGMTIHFVGRSERVVAAEFSAVMTGWIDRLFLNASFGLAGAAYLVCLAVTISETLWGRGPQTLGERRFFNFLTILPIVLITMFTLPLLLERIGLRYGSSDLGISRFLLSLSPIMIFLVCTRFASSSRNYITQAEQ